MKNLNTNESTSFESSLGSPTKPLQTYDIQKPKQIFFVNNIEDTPQALPNTIINLGPAPKSLVPEKKNLEKKIKFNSGLKTQKNKIKNKRPHILNFDAIYRNLILPANKAGKSGNKKNNNSSSKSKCNLVGTKRIRNLSNKEPNNKSK